MHLNCKWRRRPLVETEQADVDSRQEVGRSDDKHRKHL